MIKHYHLPYGDNFIPVSIDNHLLHVDLIQPQKLTVINKGSNKPGTGSFILSPQR